MISGLADSSVSSASALGHDEQPWLVNNSSTALGFCRSSPAVAAWASISIRAARTSGLEGMLIF